MILARALMAGLVFAILGMIGLFPGIDIVSVMSFTLLTMLICLVNGLAMVEPSKLPELEEWHETYDKAITQGLDPAFAVQEADCVRDRQDHSNEGRFLAVSAGSLHYNEPCKECSYHKHSYHQSKG